MSVKEPSGTRIINKKGELTIQDRNRPPLVYPEIENELSDDFSHIPEMKERPDICISPQPEPEGVSESK